MKRVAIIVGSGALDLGPTLSFAPDPGGLDTAYGQASCVPLVAEMVAERGKASVHLLARHGDGHRLAPHQINYRANVRLLADRGVTDVIAVNTVGGIAPEAENGALVIPDQVVDYTWGREHSFATHGDLRHVDFSEPFDETLRGRLLQVSAQERLVVANRGVYGCTQGPRFESSAEIVRMERDGCTLVGMTGMPETGLAREAGLAYASVCLVVTPAAGKSTAIDMVAIADIASEGMQRVARLLVAFLQGL